LGFLVCVLRFIAQRPDELLRQGIVLTRQTSSNASAATRSNVERLASLSFRSFTPPVNQFVNSATYSPAQATATSVAKMYSAYSQQESALEREVTSGAFRLIVSHSEDGLACLQTAPLPDHCCVEGIPFCKTICSNCFDSRSAETFSILMSTTTALLLSGAIKRFVLVPCCPPLCPM